MKSYNYFSALALVCVVSFSACNQDVTNPNDDNPKFKPNPQYPDSIQVFAIDNEGNENYYYTVFYGYDVNGNTILELTDNQKTERNFDSNNNLLETRRYYLSQNVWYGEFKLCYTYDENNKRQTLQAYAEFRDSVDTPIYKKGDYSWQDDRHSKCVIYRNVGKDKWMLSEIMVETFYPDGKLEYEKYYFVKPDSTMSGSPMEHKFKYDQFGNIDTYVYRDDSRVRTDTCQYVYDNLGNIITKCTTSTQFWNFSQKTEKTTTKYVYFY